MSQRSLGRLVHVSGDLIARIEKAERRATPRLLEQIDAAVGARGEIAGLVGPETPGSPISDPFVDEVDQAVKRREFLGGAVAMGLAADVWERLEIAIDSGGTGAAAAADSLLDRTSWLIRAQDRLPSAALHTLVRAHLDHLIGALGMNTGNRTALLLAAGQTSALAGWMAFDMADMAAARHHYASAMRVAREANEPELAAVTLAYASYAEVEPLKAVMLLDAAQAQLGPGASSRLRAWIAARRAEELARGGEALQALAAISTARAEYARVSLGQPPAWLDFLSRARLESMIVGALTAMRHRDAVPAAMAAQEAIGPGEVKVKAVILGDVAAAHLAAGDLAQTAVVANLALLETVNGQASLGRQRLLTLAGRLRTGGPRARDLAAELTAGLA